MRSRAIRYTLATLPPSTDADQKQLKMLTGPSGSEEATSDFPPAANEQGNNFEREHLYRPIRRKMAKDGQIYRPVNRQITVRVDADVLDWLKAQGKGYQTRINAILRREMLEASKPS